MSKEVEGNLHAKTSSICLAILVYRTPSCDRHRQTETDRQTQGHSVYRVSIASRRSNPIERNTGVAGAGDKGENFSSPGGMRLLVSAKSSREPNRTSRIDDRQQVPVAVIGWRAEKCSALKTTHGTGHWPSWDALQVLARASAPNTQCQDCETLRIPPLMSKRTIRIPDEGW